MRENAGPKIEEVTQHSIVKHKFNLFRERPTILIDSITATSRSTNECFPAKCPSFFSHKQYFILLEEKVYSIDFFKRMIRNANFGYLAINASREINSCQFHSSFRCLVEANFIGSSTI